MGEKSRRVKRFTLGPIGPSCAATEAPRLIRRSVLPSGEACQNGFNGYFIQKQYHMLLRDSGPVGSFPSIVCEFFHEVTPPS